MHSAGEVGEHAARDERADEIAQPAVSGEDDLDVAIAHTVAEVWPELRGVDLLEGVFEPGRDAFVLARQEAAEALNVEGLIELQREVRSAAPFPASQGARRGANQLSARLVVRMSTFLERARRRR